MEKERATLDQLLLQIAEILEMIQQHQTPISPELTPTILTRLDFLETNIKTLAEHQAETFKEAQLDPNQVLQETLESPSVDPRKKQLLKRAQDIQRDARAFQSALSQAMERKKTEQKSKSNADGFPSKQQMKERRKLFKSIGGDQKWIPL